MKRIKKYHIIVLILIIGMIIFIDFPLNSLPLYTARSGRICDNCHITPYKTDKQDEWPNPSFSKRKCNLSCLACHVNPGGGGLRNVTGRYYAMTTLPMFWAVNRPYHDRHRTFEDLGKMFSITKEDEKLRSLENEKSNLRVERSSLIHNLQATFFRANKYSIRQEQLESEGLREKNIQTLKDEHRNKAKQISEKLNKIEKELIIIDKKIKKTIARKKTKEGEPENKSKDEDKKADKKEFKFENKKDAKRNIEEHHKPHFFYGSDIFAYGYPFNADTIESQSEYAFARERYGELNADPLFLIGADLRPTLLFRDNRSKFFPMQVELGTAIHPIEHLTISATGAVQGRKKGFSESTKRLKLQNAYILAHEFPFMSYLQAGFFLPSFGIRHDDHTAPTRKYFDMDQSVERNTVLGVEMGMAPNYPYLSFSLFKNRKKDDPYSYTGYGMSFTGGWRDLLWGAGVSFMHKKRNIEDYGNLTAFGVNGYFNLGRIILRVPLVFQGEFNVGQKPRNILNQKKSFLAAYLQADYILVNGLDFKLAYHYFLDDLDLKIDNYVRYTFGIDYNIINNIKLTTELRYTLTSNRDTIQDMLIFFHFYL